MKLAGLDEVRLVPFAVHTSDHGSLAAIEQRSVPFAIARTFHIWGVPVGHVRGRHAHLRCHQLMVCVAGKCRVLCRDGGRSTEFQLESPDCGLLVPATLWAEQIYDAERTVLLVLTSRSYEAGDYIRDWDSFVRFRSAQ